MAVETMITTVSNGTAVWDCNSITVGDTSGNRFWQTTWVRCPYCGQMYQSYPFYAHVCRPPTSPAIINVPTVLDVRPVEKSNAVRCTCEYFKDEEGTLRRSPHADCPVHAAKGDV